MNNIDAKLLDNYIKCKNLFNECLEIERKAISKKTYQTDLCKFEEITKYTEIAHENLIYSKKEIVQAKIMNRTIPWNMDFSELIKQNFNESSDWDSLKKLIELYYIFELNGAMNFYEIATKIIVLAQGNLKDINDLAAAAIVDYRDLPEINGNQSYL